MTSTIDQLTRWPNADPDMIGLADTLAETQESWADPKAVESPAWWLLRLDAALAERDSRLVLYQAYYDGNHRLAFATEKYRARFGSLFGSFSDNWCAKVVDAFVERLVVQGFRMPADPEDTEPGDNAGALGDRAAWEIWQRNNLDAYQKIAHATALVNCTAYGLVGKRDNGKARITIEHPRQMICESDPEDPLVVRAALKKWRDDSGLVYATLYLPDATFKFQSKQKSNAKGSLSRSIVWVPRVVPDEDWPGPNPLGIVPVVPLPNEPQLLAQQGVSELSDVVPIQDAINKLVADMIIASEYQSFRQRFITGLDLPRDPVTDEPIMPFKQMLERVWMLEANKEGQAPQVGELGQVDLKQYADAVTLLVRHLASRKGIPIYYFEVPGQFPSGESLKSAETGLVARTRSKALFFGEGWEAIIRLAFATEGDKAHAEEAALETIWRNPESRAEAVIADAAVKLQTVGLPEELLWEYVGLSPQQIARAKQLRTAEAAKPPKTDIVPTVFDPVTGETVQIKDPLLRHEAPPGQQETPAPVGAGAAAR